jgi:ubiquitin carboxyl-terminal hydrolase 1
MNSLQESAFADSRASILSPPNPSSTWFRLFLSITVVALTCFALTILDAWPSSTKRAVWETIVYLTPSQIIYAMDFPSRRRKRRGEGNVGFGRQDFGNQQAKSEALQRVFGSDNDSLGTVVQRARRLSGLEKVLGSTNVSPAGLGNWDNSCYQNSIIQGLASLPSFDHYLQENLERMSQHNATATHDALRNIIGRLNHFDNEGRRLWTPSVLKSMNSWQQQDAQEYFSKIIDEVDKEILKFAKRQATELGFCGGEVDGQALKDWPQNPFQGLLAQRVGCTRCGYTEGLSLLPFTCLTVNLGGQWEYDVRDCLDEYTSLESIEGVECIKCTILRTKASLEQLLANMDINDATKKNDAIESTPVLNLRLNVTERLKTIKEVCEKGDFSDSGLYKKCNISAKSRVSSTKSKQAIVARAPNNLVIHVNRSIFDASGFQRKNHARVNFPVDLDLSKWCLGSDCEKSGPELSEIWSTSPTVSMLPKPGTQFLKAGKLYKLRAVVNHYGAHENGHYIAYRRRTSSLHGKGLSTKSNNNPDNRWYCFNDDIVSPVSEDHVLSQGGVFMLFYEAIPEDIHPPTHTKEPEMDDSVLVPQESTPPPLLTKRGNSDPGAEVIDADPRQRTSSQPAGAESGPKPQINLPTKSPESVRSSPPPENPTVQVETDAPSEPMRQSPIAPVMRTAGALSPASRKGRRSSNISIHSPSFVTAS